MQLFADRSADGIEVALWYVGEESWRPFIIKVLDSRDEHGSFELTAETGKKAVDMFYHPYAYAS